ncbi:MAG: hypothetical protein SGJ18_06120 [Pseudomonadota bacterium]|nr:hypothetical protein [Pseudomonadota bacterium]
MEFEPSGKNTSKTFFVENKFGKDIAVELKAYKRAINIDGEETREETLDFLIFPRQVKLTTGQKVAVRVTWQGTSEVKAELAYRLAADQLPISFSEKNSSKARVNIDFLLKFVASLYITPENAKSEIKIEKISKEKNRLKLTLKNTGNKHQLIANMSLQDDKEFSLKLDAINNSMTRNLLPASSLRFDLPWPEGLNETRLDSIGLKFE